jgi:hypothetical protein
LNAVTTFIVSNSVFGGDPAQNYVKELEELSDSAAIPTGTWLKIANEGDTVTIPAGLTVRYGARQGTSPGNNLVSKALSSDSFDPLVTFSTSSTFVVSNSVFGADPAQNYVKELDVEPANAVVYVNGVAVSLSSISP